MLLLGQWVRLIDPLFAPVEPRFRGFIFGFVSTAHQAFLRVGMGAKVLGNDAVGAPRSVGHELANALDMDLTVQ